MQALTYFFRLKPDLSSHYFLSPLYFLLTILSLLLLLGSYHLTFFSAKKGYTWREGSWVLRFETLLLAVSFISLSLFYLLSGDWVQGLPLYHTRIFMLLYIFFLFIPEGKFQALKDFAMAGGVYASLVALIFADISSFHFPHITNFTFYINHIILFVLSIHYLVSRKSKLKLYHYLPLLVLGILMDFFLIGFNQIFSTNYSYLRLPPRILERVFSYFYSFLPALKGESAQQYFYMIFVFFMYQLVLFMSFLVLRQIQSSFLLAKSEFTKSALTDKLEQHGEENKLLQVELEKKTMELETKVNELEEKENEFKKKKLDFQKKEEELLEQVQNCKVETLSQTKEITSEEESLASKLGTYVSDKSENLKEKIADTVEKVVEEVEEKKETLFHNIPLPFQPKSEVSKEDKPKEE